MDERRSRLYAAIRSAIFFLAAPTVVAGVVPWLLTRWQVATPLPSWEPVRWVGVLLSIGGAIALVSAFVQFVIEGIGTPAPVAPTRRLVIGGVYSYIRNPMYLAVLTIIIGQALILGQLVLLVYAAAAGLAMAAFARWVEEPVLLERFGADYAAYRRAVPGWWPRRRPWRGDASRSQRPN